MSNMIQLEEGMDRCVELLIQQLGACADDEKVIDIAEWIQWYDPNSSLSVHIYTDAFMVTGMRSMSLASSSTVACLASLKRQATMPATSTPWT
jgi:uncharacterized protein (UPF0371 family)